MRFVIYQDTAGEWRWRLLAANAQVIATAGEGYVRKGDCLHGIALVMESVTARTEETVPVVIG